MSPRKVISTSAEELVIVTKLGDEARNILPNKPIYLISALQICFSTLFGTALYQTLIFDFHLSPMILGLLTSLQAFIAIITPIIFREFIDRFGPKTVIILLSGCFLTCNLLIFVWANLIFTIIILLLDTFFTKGFWLAISLVISRFQQNVTQKDADLIYKRYTMSWSGGAIFGFLIAIILSLISNKIILHLQFALIFILISIISAYNIRYPDVESNRMCKCPESNAYSDSSIDSKDQNQFAGFSLTFILIALFSFEVLSAFIDFTMPYLFESEENSHFWVYLILFSQQINQTIGIHKCSGKSIRKKFYLFLIGMVATGSLLIWILISPSLTAFFLTMILYGGLSGLMYAFPNQTLMQYSGYDDASNNLTKNSSVSALGAGIVPLISGYLLNENLLLNLRIASNIAFLIPGLLFLSYRKGIIIQFSYVIRNYNLNIFKLLFNYLFKQNSFNSDTRLSSSAPQFVKGSSPQKYFNHFLLFDFRISRSNNSLQKYLAQMSGVP